MELRQFAAERHLALWVKSGSEIGKRRRHPWPGLEQDKRRRNAAELGDPGASRGLLRRQKTGEVKFIGRQSGTGERRKCGICARNDGNGMADTAFCRSCG